MPYFAPPCYGELPPDPDPLGYSIYGDTPPIEPTSHTDADAGSWLSQQFYIPDGSGLSLVVKALRLYVPVGSVFIGKTGKIGLQRREVDDGGIWLASGAGPGDEMDTNGSRTDFTTPLVAGWNVIPFNSDWPMYPGEGIVIGYQVHDGRYYLFSGGWASSAAVPDLAGLGFYLAERGTTGSVPGRCAYRGGWSAAHWYGIDILVEEV